METRTHRSGAGRAPGGRAGRGPGRRHVRRAAREHAARRAAALAPELHAGAPLRLGPALPPELPGSEAAEPAGHPAEPAGPPGPPDAGADRPGPASAPAGAPPPGPRRSAAREPAASRTEELPPRGALAAGVGSGAASPVEFADATSRAEGAGAVSPADGATTRASPAGRAVELAPPEEGSPIDEGESAGEPAAPLRLWQRARLAVAERWPHGPPWRLGMERGALVALCVVVLAAGGFAVHHYWSGRPQPAPPPAEPASAAEGGAPTPAASDAEAGGAPAGEAVPGGEAAGGQGQEEEKVVVDVAGEVARPGIYTLPAGSRVTDAIEAAGGSEPGADTDALNRARLLSDGEQILVGDDAGGAPPGEAAGGEAPGADAGPVSLNTATVEQLQQLPGVGPVLAQSIVSHREEQGPFTSVDQLREVSGIGDQRLAELRDRVRL